VGICRLYGPYYRWYDAFADDIDIHKLTMYPARMFVEPFVTELANKFSDCLAKAHSENSAGQDGTPNSSIFNQARFSETDVS
jgi:hypothetical protein